MVRYIPYSFESRIEMIWWYSFESRTEIIWWYSFEAHTDMKRYICGISFTGLECSFSTESPILR